MARVCLAKAAASYGQIWTTVILGPLWPAWHLPLFQVSGWSRASPWQFFLVLLGVCFLLAAAANLVKLAVLVAIVPRLFQYQLWAGEGPDS